MDHSHQVEEEAEGKNGSLDPKLAVRSRKWTFAVEPLTPNPEQAKKKAPLLREQSLACLTPGHLLREERTPRT